MADPSMSGVPACRSRRRETIISVRDFAMTGLLSQV
jgi:hypothetical protein